MRKLLPRRARELPHRDVVVDGNGSPEVVHDRVIAAVMPMLAQLAA